MATTAAPGLVIVTKTFYSTVPARALPTAASSVSLISSGRIESSVGLNSLITSILSGVSPSILPTTSVTGLPPLPSNFADPSGDRNPFNDASLTALCIAISVLGLLLFSLLAYTIWARCIGGRKCKCGIRCGNCKDLQDKLDRWERGDIKRITKEMVKQREAYNSRVASSRVSATARSDADLEMGDMDRDTAREGALAKLEGRIPRQRMPTASILWDGMKTKLQGVAKVKSSGKEVTTSAAVRPETGDRFFKVEAPSVPQLSYQPSDKPLYGHQGHPTASTYSASIYSQATHLPQAQGADAPRPFADQTAPGMPPLIPRRMRESIDAPKTYTAYLEHVVAPRDQERKVLLAESDLTSRVYKEAEAVIARGSASSSELNRKLALVNRVDQEVHRARHPSLYSNVRGTVLELEDY